MEKSCKIAAETLEKSCTKMLKRKISKQLQQWRDSHSGKALLIKGARQVGKTTSIRDFAKDNYANFVEVNFEKSPVARQAFEGNLDAKTIIMNLSAMGFGPFERGETLVFFDEIQSCPKARTAIKFLVEDGAYDYIESGSLLGINYGEISSYPMGFEHEIEMFPLDFEEFLWACGIGSNVIDNLREQFAARAAVPDFIHEQIMRRYREYLIIGGMPEVVSLFTRDPDVGKAVALQRDLAGGYRRDISKYAGAFKNLATAVFDSIPVQLSKEDKRFVLADIEENASRRKYGEPIQWLVDAGVALCSYNVRAFELPFPPSENLNLYKLYLHDTGILCSMAIDGLQGRVLSGEIDINEGALTENFVAGELRRHGHALNYYDRKSKHELDFVYPDDGRITAVEVKSGNSYRAHASLDNALRLFPDRIGDAIVLCKGNVESDSGTTYLPLYMAMFL